MICAYTSICNEDYCWVDQYLEEAERLQMPFVVHFDRCTDELKRRMMNHELAIDFTEQNDCSIEFNEQHKQAAFDRVVKHGYKLALAWDVDETFEVDAKVKLQHILHDAEELQMVYLHLWGFRGQVRIDGPFGLVRRVKLQRLSTQWRFDHPITNGPKPVDGHTPTVAFSNVACLHHGLKTAELRKLHKERWDRIYTAAVGANPYKLWEYACDSTITPQVIRHGYL